VRRETDLHAFARAGVAAGVEAKVGPGQADRPGAAVDDEALGRPVEREGALAALGRDDGVAVREAAVDAGLNRQALERRERQKGASVRADVAKDRELQEATAHSVGRLVADEGALGLARGERSGQGEAGEEEGGGGGEHRWREGGW